MPPSLAKPSSARPPTVLVVDDEPSLRLGFRLTLTTRGFNVVAAEDGSEALAKIQTQSDLDLMLLDLRMPGLGGLEVLSELRKEKKVLPTIIASAHLSNLNAFRAIRRCCVDFLPKPIFPDHLRLLVKRILTEEDHFRAGKEEALDALSMARCMVRRQNHEGALEVLGRAPVDPDVEVWREGLQAVIDDDFDSFPFQTFTQANAQFYQPKL